MPAPCEGRKIPDVKVQRFEGGELHEVSARDYFAGRRVVAFGLPGAFTPTCSSNHLPRYVELAPELKKRGVDAIVCISVNDPYVMEEWARTEQAEGIELLPDGNGELTEALGMIVDKKNLCLGRRSWRYSMLVEDGTIRKMFVEPDASPASPDPYEVSDADTMLRFIDPNAKLPHDVVLLTRAGCKHSVRAKKMLEKRGLPYDEIRATPRRLRATSGKTTTPQVFIDGRHVGGADELSRELERL